LKSCYFFIFYLTETQSSQFLTRETKNNFQSGAGGETCKMAAKSPESPGKYLNSLALPPILSPTIRKYSVNTLDSTQNLDISILLSRKSHPILPGSQIYNIESEIIRRKNIPSVKGVQENSNMEDEKEKIVQIFNNKLRKNPLLSDFSQQLSNKLEFFKDYKEIKDSKLKLGEKGKSRKSILMRLFEMNNVVPSRKVSESLVQSPRSELSERKQPVLKSTERQHQYPKSMDIKDGVLSSAQSKKRLSFLHNEMIELENLKSKLFRIKI
jgi:hypothetical protein